MKNSGVYGRLVCYAAVFVGIIVRVLTDYTFLGAVIILAAGAGLIALSRLGKAAAVQKTEPKPQQEPEKNERPRNYWRDPIAMLDSEIDEILDREAEPAIRLKRHWPPSEPFAGHSMLGGVPNLPDGVDWPVNSKTGLALHHLAQIDLAEMPKLDGGAALPSEGTLWFFADIDEELGWDEGADTPHSAVVYHPNSVAGIDAAKVPENLPEVDHAGDSMTGTLWGFRGPKFSVYPRWPVSGHETVAWAYSDQKPEGVTDPMAFSEAQEARIVAEKARIVGPSLQENYSAQMIGVKRKERRTRPDGTEFDLEVSHYAPQKWGGMFPYTNRFGALVLRRAKHDLVTSFESASRQVEIQKRREAEPSDFDLKRVRTIGPVLEPLDALLTRLEQAPPEDAFLPELQEAMDQIMTGCFDRAGASNKGDNYVRQACVDLVAQGMDAPEILNKIPPEMIEMVEPTVLPSHNYTEHFLLGPKGAASNPTAGRGVRLAQFDSDYALQFMFCDVGIVDFWIDANDLAAGRWDRAWAATAGG